MAAARQARHTVRALGLILAGVRRARSCRARSAQRMNDGAASRSAAMPRREASREGPTRGGNERSRCGRSKGKGR
eukprot:690779-Prymnesium_polylepis.3